MNFLDCFRDSCQKFPNKIAFTFLDGNLDEVVSISYSQLQNKIFNYSEYLIEKKLSKKRVFLYFESGLEFIVAFISCLSCGAIPIPITPSRSSRYGNLMQKIFEDAKPHLIITTGKFLDHLKKSWTFLSPSFPIIDYNDLRESTSNKKLAATIKSQESSIAFVQYTSGSTSNPKGVVITHKNLVSNLDMIVNAFEDNHNSVGVGWLPLFHDMGLISTVLAPLHIGASFVFMAPSTFVKRPINWLKTISKYGATTSGGPNFAYDLCIKNISEKEMRSLNLSTWSLAFCGSEPIHEKTLAAFYKKFKPYGFHEKAFFPCYGMAETVVFISGSIRKKLYKKLVISNESFCKGRVSVDSKEKYSKTIVSCGKVNPRMSMEIVDPESFQKCKENQIGEIWLRGDNISPGYFRKNALNKIVFQAKINKGKTSYFRTGDLGFTYEGELYVTGRLKEVIIINGKNYYPQDIEAVVTNTYKDIFIQNGCVAFAQSDCNNEITVISEVNRLIRKQFDIAKTFEKLSEEIFLHFQLNLAELIFVKQFSIPKTTSGKIQRVRCKDIYLRNELKVIEEYRNTPSNKPRRKISLPKSVPLNKRIPSIEGWLVEKIHLHTKIPKKDINVDSSFYSSIGKILTTL